MIIDNNLHIFSRFSFSEKYLFLLSMKDLPKFCSSKLTKNYIYIHFDICIAAAELIFFASSEICTTFYKV